MPFTFSHPAAVLPIHAKFKKWISLPALVVGSMVPDAAYYLPLPAGYKEAAHTFLGVFTLGLPVGIVLLLIFYWVAPEVIYLLPSPQREALSPPAVGSQQTKAFAPALRQAWMAVCAIVIGAETHVLWDSFTHDNGWVVLRAPFLRIALWRDRFSTPFTVYNALEYLSSLFGLCIVLYFCDRWMKARGAGLWTLPERCWRLYLWLGVLTACFAEALVESRTINAVVTLAFLHRRRFALLLFTDFVRNLLFAVVVLAVCVKLLRRPSSLRDTVY